MLSIVTGKTLALLGTDTYDVTVYKAGGVLQRFARDFSYQTTKDACPYDIQQQQ